MDASIVLFIGLRPKGFYCKFLVVLNPETPTPTASLNIFLHDINLLVNPLLGPNPFLLKNYPKRLFLCISHFSSHHRP